jgi:hypothetical protein
MAFTQRQRNDPPITLGQILQLAPGGKENPQWINGVLTVGFTQCRDAQPGSQFAKGEAVIFDPQNPQVALKATFAAYPQVSGFQGQLVQISGNGICYREYRGVPELSCGKGAQLQIVGGLGGQPAAPQPQAQPAPQQWTPAPNQAPQAQGAIYNSPLLPPGAAPARPAYVPAPTQAVQAPASMPVAPQLTLPAFSDPRAEDIARGRALNNAVALMVAAGVESEQLFVSDFSISLYNLASDLLRIDHLLASRLAPPVKQRVGDPLNDGTPEPVQYSAQVPIPPAPQPIPQYQAPQDRRAGGIQGGPDGQAFQQAAAFGTDPDNVPF